MTLKQRVVHYADNSWDVTLTITEATSRVGMHRALLIEQARAEETKKDVPASLIDAASQLLHTVLYPSMIAATVEATGFAKWPITFEEYADLPEQLVMQWEDAVFSLNAHWRPKSSQGNEDETEAEELKKAVSSTSS
jgi:hypothetical protein